MSNKLNTDSYKGVRDFYPEEQFIQNYIFSVWRKTVESFGYVEYNASILEPSEIYKEKSGDEIINEQTFTFIDRGDREVTLRPEMTPTVARMVAAKRRELGFPLRWYSIPNLFRYEAPQRGRLREHWQLNIDIFGVKGLEADIEIIVVAYNIMKNFGATDLDFEIRLNSNSGDVVELEQVMIGLKYAGITNTKVDKTLKRGQAYYTGVVFEVFDTDPENTRSLFGGGRYNNLLELFSNDNMPAVGFGAGDVSIKDFLATHDLLPKHRSTTDLMLVLQGEPTVPAVIEFNNIVKEIIETGVNVSTDQSNREKGDMYKVAEKQALSYICFVTEESLKNKELILKNMQSREEFKIKTNKLDEIRKIVKT